MRLRQCGFTLLELILALTLTAFLIGSVNSLISATSGFLREQSLRIGNSDRLRTAVEFVTAELRELDAGGGDLVQIGPTSLTYRGMRSINFVCDITDPGAGEITVRADASYGLRRLEPFRDSVLVYTGNVLGRRLSGAWLTAAVTAAGRRATCGDGAPGLRVTLTGAAARAIGSVPIGAPIRGYQVTRLLQYRDGRGSWWLGMREWRSGSGWSTTQPVVGPLAEGGFVLQYLDRFGVPTAERRSVEMVRVTVAVVGAGPRASLRQTAPATDSLTALVHLRNGAAW